MNMEYFGNQKSKTPFVVNTKTALILVIEGFFSFKGMITFHSHYGSPCSCLILYLQITFRGQRGTPRLVLQPVELQEGRNLNRSCTRVVSVERTRDNLNRCMYSVQIQRNQYIFKGCLLFISMSCS